MAQDISEWVERCYTCIQFRKRPQKPFTGFFTSQHQLPWHHVLLDFEGPITPADVDGGRYILTYTCLVCYGSLLEVVPALTHNHVRRALLACVLRAKTIPCLAGHDGDQAFTSLLFQELEAPLDITDSTGRRYRPTELAPVEREHQETQRSLGMLLQEVIRCMPGE